MTDKPTVCVFCGSSSGKNDRFAVAADELGRGIARRGFRLLYGGGGYGLMGATACAARQENGEVLGIMPKFLRGQELPPDWKYDLVLTDTLQERKAQMLALADAFVVLPGGVGTMDEFFEILTEASLDRLPKPILLIDVDGYYAPLLAFLGHMVEQGMFRSDGLDFVQTVPTVDEALTQLDCLAAGPQTGLRAGE